MITDKRVNGSVLLVDALQLRRIQTVTWLTGWAEENGLAILPADPAGASEYFDDITDCKLVIFSVGGVSLSNEAFTRQIKMLHALWDDIPFIILSDIKSADEVAIALECGALGFFPSCLEPGLALQALSFILNGGSYFPPSAVRGLQNKNNNGDDGGHDLDGCPDKQDDGNKKIKVGQLHKPGTVKDYSYHHDYSDGPESACHLCLTQRQNEVLDCLREGHPNKVIARTLGITEATAKIHVREIMRRLGVNNRTQAALWRFPDNDKSLYEGKNLADCPA